MTVTTIRPAEAAKIDRPVERGEQAKPQTIGGELLRGVRVSLDARLGQAAMTAEELMALKTGSVVTLQAALADQVELYLNENLVARGEIVAVGDKYGVRIVEIIPVP